MKIIEVKDYQEMSNKATAFLLERIHNNPTIKIGLATGGTPVGTYENLIADHQKNGTSYQNIKTFNLDEYIGLSGEHEQSYRYFMNKQLFNHIDVKKTNTFIPQGDVKDVEAECFAYEKLLEEHGGVDLQILGIGGNGHIGFNEPGTSFDSKTHVVELDSSTREANARFFESLDEVPTQAITMGISTIMKSKEILLLISGESKREAVSNLLNGEITEDFPASILRNHPNVTIIADKSALGN